MKKIIAFFISALLVLSLSSCSSGGETYKKDMLDLFDTASSISAADSSQADFNSHFDSVYNELLRYSRLFDIYKDYQGVVNLKYINENAAAAPVNADKAIIDLLLFGKQAYEITGGRVNIAMGAVLSLWHNASQAAAANPENAALPSQADLEAAALHCDIEKLIINENESTVYFADSQMSLDVGAIAKGFVCEKIADYIAENNIWSSAVLNLGGNIKTIGTKGGKPFSIAIENPSGGYLDVLSVSNGTGVVTSGDYQRYFTVDGQNYCHIISPETLMPPEYVSSVSVICADTALADALSTALFDMPPEQAIEFVDSQSGVEAVCLDKNGTLYYSAGYKDLVKK